MTHNQHELGPWMDLLGAVISLIRLDAIALRRKGVLDENGKLTFVGNRRFPRYVRTAKNEKQVTGLQRRDEIETIGRMVYQGGMTNLMTRLGLPDLGGKIKSDVERQSSRTHSNRRAR
jgi:hypothetical protein